MSRNGAPMDELAVGSATLRMRVEGRADAPALVLSHMLGTDLSLWGDLVPAFAEHFRVIAYDTRGHGGSGLGDDPVSIGRLGRDVLAILDALEIERAHFCGISMGGAVGLWLLAHAPTRIERAVIAGSAAKLGTPATWNGRIAAALAEGMEQAVEPTIERWFSPAFVDEAPDEVEAVRAMIRATPPEGYAACCAALRDMDLREAVRGVAHPVLVVRGAGDPSVTAEDATELVEAMAGATALELDARHCCQIEAEAAFAAASIKFLTAKVASRRAKTPPRRTSAPRPAGKAAASAAKPAARRGGGRGLVAARRPVAKTNPASGKAVAKASASRKTAARSVARAPEPAPSRRRGAAKPAPAKRVPAKAAPVKSAPTKTAPVTGASSRAAARKRATPSPVAPARRAAASTRPAAAKVRTAAVLRAAAGRKSRLTKAGGVQTAPAGAGTAKRGTVKSGTAKSGTAKSGAAKSGAAKTRVAKAASGRAEAAPARAFEAKAATGKTASKISKGTKPTAVTKTAREKPPAKAGSKVAPTKPSSIKAPADGRKGPRPAGRGPAGSGRRKP